MFGGRYTQVMKKYINIKNSIRILFLIYIMCNIYNAEIAKSTYRHDVDYQVSRLQDYHVKPIQIDKTDRLGGYYSVYLYYGDISDKELDSVISDLYNDGFIEYSDKHNKKFYKNNVSVIFVHNNDKSIKIRVSIYEGIE